MPRKQWFLLAVALVLAAAYVCCFTHWFRHEDIQIYSTARAGLPRLAGARSSANVAFGLDQEYRLAEIKVVPLAAWQTNPDVLPLWHLVGNHKSEPIKFFLYGEDIPGMRPDVPGARPEPLETGVAYRLLISAGSVKGQHDFWIGPNPAEGTNSTGR